jgi:hypothetical protein
MSLTNEYPEPRYEPVTSQDSIAVVSPAASPSGTLVSRVTLNSLNRDTALIGTQFGAGNYLVIMSLTVTGSNPPSDNKVPALAVSYSYDGTNGTAPYTLEGTTSQGTSVVNGFTVSQSVSFSHNGQGVISVGTVGGRYTGNWTYNITASIYRL